MLQAFVHLYIAIRPHIFSVYNDKIIIVARTLHTRIQRYFCHKHDDRKRICVSYSFVNITVIPVHFYYFTLCFKFYFPIVDIIVKHLYLLFLPSRKTNTHVVT